MLGILAAAKLSGALALGAIGASDTAGQGRMDVDRPAKGDGLPPPQRSAF